jgi:phospholipase D1/2
VQVLRSASDWSHGILTETSIQGQAERYPARSESVTDDLEPIADAYCQMIIEANHTIYIENQFFVTSTIPGHPVANQIGAALAQRIISAARDGRQFKVSIRDLDASEGGAYVICPFRSSW